ncbi:MAG: DEAD/DEAH box helicase [Planctomycetota bacterium]
MISHSKIERIRRIASKMQHFSDAQLKSEALGLRYEVESGAKLASTAIKTFGLVVESCRRRLGYQPYDVQLQCGLAMTEGRIAEMKTGEGKTLTATLIASLLAFKGKGVHVVTFNDYLAKRDCETMSPVYEALGLTVKSIVQETPHDQRKSIYDADITYGTAKEFGFDFLRDRMRMAETGRAESGVMRGLQYALIDEADSILIDEAKTPLVIGVVAQSEEVARQQCYRWAAEFAEQFEENKHYHYDVKTQKIELTMDGVYLARKLPQNPGTEQFSVRELYKFIENAIRVRRDFHLDKTYAIVNGEVQIIDEFTGRPAEGRHWQGGIHQSVQAKEGLEITPQNRNAASVTIQSLFKKYKFYCGMTGTIWTSKNEVKKVYRKKVIRIPTHKPICRSEYPSRVFANQESKFTAIAQSTRQLIDQGRAVLIGTRSVLKSELLACQLAEAGIDFEILNARYLEREAEIVAGAGRANRVTIATNMAGRGTHIDLDESVREAGGLHVILSEIHESQRIDWQLIGRGARQGQPGSFQIFVSLDDEILKIGFGPVRAKRIKMRYRDVANEDRLSRLFKFFRTAQARTEKRYLIDRMILLNSDFEKQKSLFATGQDPYLNIVHD